MAKTFNGEILFNYGYNIETQKPLDTRTVVDYYEDLPNATTGFVYAGIIVYVTHDTTQEVENQETHETETQIIHSKGYYFNEVQTYNANGKPATCAWKKLIDFSASGKIDSSQLPIGENDGVAPLDANGLIPAEYLPSYVDDVIEGYYDVNNTQSTANGGKFYTDALFTAANAITAETGKIYVDLNTNKSYRWGGSVFVEISTNALVLGQSITSAEKIGGVDANHTYTEGTPLETILRDLLTPVQFPTLTAPSVTLTVTANPTISDLLEVGFSQSATLTVGGGRGSVSPDYTTQNLTDGYLAGEVIGYKIDGSWIQDEQHPMVNEKSVTITKATEGKLTFSGTILFAAGSQPKDSKGNNYTPSNFASYIAQACSKTTNKEYTFTYYIYHNGYTSRTDAVNNGIRSELAKHGSTSSNAAGTLTKNKYIGGGSTLFFGQQTAENRITIDLPSTWTNPKFYGLNPNKEGIYDVNLSDDFVEQTGTFNHDTTSGIQVAYKRYIYNEVKGIMDMKITWTNSAI